MTEQVPQFPEYGDGGDEIGARRMRRAFRLCVAACIFFTAALWISEYFLSHGDAERLYISALTKQTESARALLRQAVKHDEASGEAPNPRYLEALAEREEDDMILATYRRAYELDRSNASLAMRYGCQLMRAGRMDDARERFSEAAKLAPANALPAYLEAAALALAEENEEALRESLRIIAQANSGRKEIRFPRPLWHAKLPQSGKLYAELQERIILETSTPLHNYSRFVMGQAAEAVEKKRVQYWDSWLEMVQRVGQLLVLRAGDAEAGAAPSGAGSAWQVNEGLAMQKAAVELRRAVHEIERGEPNVDLIEFSVRLGSAQAEVREFLESRSAKAAESEKGFVFPVQLAIGQTLPVLVLCYAFSYLLAKLLGSSRKSWTVSHAVVGKWFLGISAGVFLIVLMTISIVQHATVFQTEWIPVFRNIWWVTVAVMAGFSFVYPVLVLPGIRQTASVSQAGEESDDVVRVARKRFRVAYVSLIRRYLGVALGIFLTVVCIWIILHRVFFALYPWQFGLLANSFAAEELELVRHLASTMPR